jgi:GNAT superfamily N-acetyltransferase
MPSRLQVDDLRDRPELVGEVADRIWRAWWRDAGFSLDELTALVRESLARQVVPSAFVAHEAGRFSGTASLIAHDMDARPNYSPWIAAVWVDPDHRLSGVGSRLVRKAVDHAFTNGIERLYLYCEPAKGPFYAKMGWRRIEQDVGGNDIYLLDAPLNP